MTGENKALPAIPAKRYFTIGEVSELCGVKSYVLRYWEQEFTQLRPMKRRGNRRYYQHHEVLLIRRIRELLYDQGFTISGARNQLVESGYAHARVSDEDELEAIDEAAHAQAAPDSDSDSGADAVNGTAPAGTTRTRGAPAVKGGAGDAASRGPGTNARTRAGGSLEMPATVDAADLRQELLAIRALLVG